MSWLADWLVVWLADWLCISGILWLSGDRLAQTALDSTICVTVHGYVLLDLLCRPHSARMHLPRRVTPPFNLPKSY